MRDHLISTYTISEGLRQSSSYKKYPSSYFKKRQAHNVELEESEPEDLEEASKDAFASSSKFLTKDRSGQTTSLKAESLMGTASAVTIQ
ncbi:hypothetical protein CVT26_002944 [Gymnopilus dilepis]|uniref:Uncharacterized protein n=1 Tax=Gymnopilus dilepis TaxID=231916 RepID=A0A409Y4K3_9AGAR|nr:hypothetical protein CVT26_002944 [Gymnopilus dilepis]